MGDITAQQYFAAVVGLSLIRGWYRDGDANAARMQELSSILDRGDEFPWNLKLNPTECDLDTGYAAWAPVYDGANPLVETEEACTLPLLRSLVGPGDRVLDAACGTGRNAGHLAGFGAGCVGLDRSAEMLAVARAKLPEVRFEEGDVEALPFADDEFDAAVSSLALCHLADPSRAVTELARVVRPEGSIVITDPHPGSGIAGGQAFFGGLGEGMRWVRNHYHQASTWLRAFRAAGVDVTECLELAYSDDQIAGFPAAAMYGEATAAAVSGLPCLWVWVLRVPPARRRPD
mgnify:CR=1 FL=1